MFMFVGLDTHSFILESVLHSVNSRDPNRIDKYAGYYGQACSYITFALTNLFAPSLIRSYDPKWSVFIGSIFSTIYYTGFQYISSYYFYTSAVLLGIGSAGTSETQTCCIKKLSSYSYIYLKLNDISHSFLIFLI
ncbi:unnamed protein product [Enterobius vermicularis]|uniref:UNC93-like protein MFSD11 (Trinotate prediction) n=1 Tax=Enterobius vermicularis TaxID=51028 RepID=A0A0N4UZ84_ENTVE|nr:unnamed protein product [Enterobius vermicularis]